MILTFRQLRTVPADWKPANAGRPASQFRANYADTLEILDREVHHLGGTDVFLQVVTDSRGVRLDGQLRADAKVDHPGVILTIETKKRGTLVFSTDRFVAPYYRSGPSWQHNLRAIALGLEALRTVERYGIADTGQQYAGYRELGAGIALGSGMTLEDAARLLIEHGEVMRGNEPAEPEDIIDAPDVAAAAYRTAAKRNHPDQGGDPDLFRRITEARDLLAGAQ